MLTSKLKTKKIISSQNKTLIKKFCCSKKKKNTKISIQQFGIVYKVVDEIVTCTGLPKIKYGETVFIVIEGIRYNGLVININKKLTGCVFFTNVRSLIPGLIVTSTSKPLYVQISSLSIGKLVDALGYDILNTKNMNKKNSKETSISNNTVNYKVERPAPGICVRQRIYQPLHTGNILVDTLFPIGRGQRELIIGDRQTGKTTVALNAIRNQHYDSLLINVPKYLFCVYVAVGQKKSTIMKVFNYLKKKKCLLYTLIVAASSSDSAALQYLAPYSGCSMAEYFRDRGQDTLIIYDDLSAQAVAYRQVSLLLRRPPGREAYPGDIFYLHARLLERAAKMSTKFCNGSLTALPIVQTLVGDISAYIPTNVISITDGQIFLDSQIFNSYYKPAVNINLSVSRVGSNAQILLFKAISSLFKNTLQLYLGQIGNLDSAKTYRAKLINHIGKRLFIIINHRDFLCVEVQFSLIVFLLSGFLNYYNINEVYKFVRYFFKYLNFNWIGLNYLQGINLKAILKAFSGCRKIVDFNI